MQIRNLAYFGLAAVLIAVMPPMAAQAPTIRVVSSGDVGIGTTSPSEQLHVSDTAPAGGNPRILVTGHNFSVMALETVGGTHPGRWAFVHKTDGSFSIQEVTGGVLQPMHLTRSGDLTIHGDFFAHGSTRLNVPDYVFGPDYGLMPLDELEAYIQKEKHLPGIDSADKIVDTGLNMTQMQLKLLEKIEELTLHTIAQQKMIETLSARLGDPQ